LVKSAALDEPGGFVNGLVRRQRERTPMPVELDDDERIFVGALELTIRIVPARQNSFVKTSPRGF
jgi:hypothetical protein